MGSHALSPPSKDATAVMVALRRIVRMLRVADREAETTHGLSSAQLFVLNSLWNEPAGSLHDLAARTMTDQSSVSTVVAKLVERGLVARTTSATDRRRTELRLTSGGERVVRTAPRMPQTMIADVIGSMTDRRRVELVRSLEAFASAIGANEMPDRMLFEDEPRARRRSRTNNVTAK
jgi:DNA-binding MarR family transcriptional regulator